MAKILLLYLCFSFQLQARNLDRTRIVVGDQYVLQSEIDGLKEQLNTNPGLSEVLGFKQKRPDEKEVINYLVNDRVTKHVLKQNGVSVSQGEVDSQIKKMADNNKSSVASLKKQVQAQGVPFELYKKNLQAQIERRHIFERELRNEVTQPNEDELRELYFDQSGVEYNLKLIVQNNSNKTKKQLTSLAKQLKSGRVDISSVQKKWTPIDLGWTSLSDLNEAFAKAIASSKDPWAGPIVDKGKVHFFLVEGKRQATEESFQKAKDKIKNENQFVFFERAYNGWLQKQKKEVKVIVNP